MKIKMSIKFYLAVFFLLTFVSPIFAAGDTGEDTLGSVIKVMIAITAFLVAFIMWLVLVYSERGDAEGETFLAPLKSMLQMITKMAPMDKEQEILLDHDYDGIKELDNKIPPWFSFLFYGSILFAIVYMIDYHVIGDGNIQENEYLAEVKQAAIERKILAASGSMIDEESVTKLTDASALASGKEIFDKNCSACHGFGGEGLVGPNFTDDFWIHGGGIKNVFKTVKYGVPQKGMISWQTQLDPIKMQEVSSYILSLRGTNPSNQKGPEGEKWDASKEATADANATMNDKGIGPISSIEIPEEIDESLAKMGEDLFVIKCSACHKINKRFVGPALRGVTRRRSPEWIMNMILDPDKMVKENPAAKQLLMEYLSPMANQSLNNDEARSILEYFRTQLNEE